MKKPMKTMNGIWSYWTWMHWLVLAVVLAISCKEVYQNQSQRLRVVEVDDVNVIEENIQEYNTMAERLAQLEVLPPVKSQWQYVPAIATRYGVDLSVLSSATDLYDGPLAAWHGRISGRVGSVLVAALELQKTVPTYLYDININNGNAQLSFSVIGSE